MESKILTHLLQESWKNPVFGDSFGHCVAQKTGTVLAQAGALLHRLTPELSRYIAEGSPDRNKDEIGMLIKQIAAKTVGFCPALSAGDLDDLDRLGAVAVAIGLIYWADQSMDRGDKSMLLAVQMLNGRSFDLPDPVRQVVLARLQALRHIQEKIEALARPEDTAHLLACFHEEIMHNEARMQQFALDYTAATDPGLFLREHARYIAGVINATAALPSAVSPLYAIYRQHDGSLPGLTEVYSEPVMCELLQVCNTVIRVADDLGDWQVDAGHHPAWGVFNVNVFNQTDPAFIREFLALAKMNDSSLQASLFEAFAHFHDNDGEREQCGVFILNSFLDNVRNYIAHLPPGIQSRFSLYIQLCKRTLEAGYVNKMGDVALSDTEY